MWKNLRLIVSPHPLLLPPHNETSGISVESLSHFLFYPFSPLLDVCVCVDIYVCNMYSLYMCVCIHTLHTHSLTHSLTHYSPSLSIRCVYAYIYTYAICVWIYNLCVCVCVLQRVCVHV
jgi:uncharacterized membrane protein